MDLEAIPCVSHARPGEVVYRAHDDVFRCPCLPAFCAWPCQMFTNAVPDQPRQVVILSVTYHLHELLLYLPTAFAMAHGHVLRVGLANAM